MSYEGVKFRLIRTGNQPPEHPWLEDLQKWCTIFHEEKMAPFYEGGSHGNLSFRVEPGSDSFIITAANSSLKESTTNDRFYLVSKIDPGKNMVYASGLPEKKPSSEAMLHDAIYKCRPEVMAILHGHCKEITKNATKAGIVSTREFVESGTQKIIDSVLEVLGDNNFIEIKDHGFISLGKSIKQTGKLSLQMRDKCIAID